MINTRITFLLIAANLIMYVLMVGSGVSFFAPTTEQILHWGGCNSQTILHGEPWRLFSSMFVHFGIIHLVMNLYVLFDIGTTLEPLIGKARFTALYLASGIFGGLASQFAHLHSYTVEAGASGAIFGIIGGLFVLLNTELFSEERRDSNLKKVIVFIVMNLGYGLQQSNVNVAAHLGGLFSGFVLGFGLYPSLIFSQKPLIKRLTILVIALVTLASSAKALNSMKNSDVFQFDGLAIEFSAMQEKIAKIHEGIPLKGTLLFFETIVLPEWDKMKQLMDKAKGLNLSKDKAKRRDYLVTWISLNSRKFHLCARALREQTNAYDSKIKEIDTDLSKLHEENSL